MRTSTWTLLLFIVVLLQGCIEAPSNARKNTQKSLSTNTAKGATSTSPTFNTDEALYWYTTYKVTGTITLNKNIQDVIYLRGKTVHDFLSSKDANGTEYYKKQFCLVGNFSQPLTYKQFRIRALPISTTGSKTIERLLRIDVPNASDNGSACQNTTIDTVLPASAAYSFPDICTNCTGQITTANLTLYEAKTSPLSLVKVDSTKMSLSSALVRVDLTSNSTDSSSSCTNASCGAKGFDCCISGQCVKDGSEKTNASLDPQYAQAKIDYAANPLSFINYPNIFYICANISHTPVTTGRGSGTTTTPISDAEARVSAYLNDYICTTEAVASPASYLNCRNYVSGAPSSIDKTEAAYSAIKKKLAIACGCTAKDSEMAVKCPDWGVVPVYKSGALKTNANIIDFNCYTPAPPNPIGPITNLNVTVPNRSAPHRFYSINGTGYDDLTGLLTKSPTLTQEGDDFYYLDEYNKVGPVNGSFNINSVLGRMTIDLSHTAPAKQVTVELGKTYILSATSGYFTPCSQCAKDSWFQSFTAYPTSQRGTGLQASGYTTSRDTYSGNTTFGNYEDTKFGRACYVPVTMLPMAHQRNAVLQTQRQNRLKTQAAMYMNGYQRDWYGFNKGALIGSFDGVTWFAIGTGRRATATSTKLYLALNASFLDLADKTDTIVNIIPDFSANTAADYDFDPDISMTDPRQNTAGTCQRYHQCSTDADCVAQLGWEYVCADVSQIKTKWPLYDSDAKETVNQERTGSLFEILQGTISTSNGKRCLYRGAGAPCKRDYSSLNDYNKKALTCAPNFYCASLTANKFNDELVRSPNELDNILFGMDTNILGRPLNYVTAGKSLSSEIVSNIKYNASNAVGLTSSDSDDMGLCRPGKSLTGDEYQRHSNPDNSKRTDYISQIGSCNSLSSSYTRFNTCPAFDGDLNYASPSADADAYKTYQETQNSCGGESKHTSTSISAFSSIEGLSLLNLQNIILPTLAQDACLRRAGSVCHTDLDCGPNKLHEEAVGTIDIKYFGETEAEQLYWKESLVCGQGDPVPALGTTKYFDYKLSANRCCREIGKDFTMFTQGPKSIVPENTGSNENLIVGKFPYYDPSYNAYASDIKGPAAKYRYSRYTISTIAKEDDTKFPLVAATAEPEKNQWEVINETGSLTCCGGGWIRKFADGTHDWKVKNRLSIDSNNFNCLNFRSPLANSNYNSFVADKVNSIAYQREYELFCKYPDVGGCMQVPYPDASGFTIISPTKYEPSQAIPADNSGWSGAFSGTYGNVPQTGYSRIDTSPSSDPIDGTEPWTQFTNSDVPYPPVAYNYTPIPYDVDSRTGLSYNFFTDRLNDRGVEMYLPAYVGWDGDLGVTGVSPADKTFIKGVYIKYFFDAPKLPEVYDITNNIAPPAECNAVINITGAATPAAPIDGITTDDTWCITVNTKTQNRPVMIVKSGAHNWKYAGIIIDFKPIEANNGTKVATPGNPMYYLQKLARLELLGIPQITYEPLYCNSDQTKLVPGIFKSNIKTRSDFQTNSITVEGIIEESNLAGYGNVESKGTYQDKIDHSAVFSSKDFTCCTPMGKSTTSADRCCSGYAALASDGKTNICKLPKGTDLNVYFNKFVSSEGVGADLPGGGLIAKSKDVNVKVDFDERTGEPLANDTTYKKIFDLGAVYCSSGKVVMGGAFGMFPPEPFSGSYRVTSGNSGSLESRFPMSIVDSVLDFSSNDTTIGKVPFDSGFKWNHHYYCN